jgi:hypothetical protein
MCENIMPNNASGSETIQHIKNINGAITENIMEMMPRTIPAVAKPLLCPGTPITTICWGP